jgi:DNA uptake protein ComE-like DNA-binding protein
MRTRTWLSAFTVAALLLTGTSVSGQVGKGLLDLNLLSEKDLAGLPNVSPALAKAIAGKQPFASIVDFNTFVMSQGLTQEQATAIYDRAFIHLNLNTATPAEIMLVPRIARIMPREFDEYRPWRSWAQFDREIGKYVKNNPGELERLKKYVFIPINLNTATDEVFLTIPGVGAKMVHEFKEYRPWKTKAQFEKEIGKYVSGKEVARLWRFMVIE